MKMVTIRMEDFLYDFYEKVRRQANLPPEQVMADALFKLAGELSLRCTTRKRKRNKTRQPSRRMAGVFSRT